MESSEGMPSSEAINQTENPASLAEEYGWDFKKSMDMSRSYEIDSLGDMGAVPYEKKHIKKLMKEEGGTAVKYVEWIDKRKEEWPAEHRMVLFGKKDEDGKLVDDRKEMRVFKYDYDEKKWEQEYPPKEVDEGMHERICRLSSESGGSYWDSVAESTEEKRKQFEEDPSAFSDEERKSLEYFQALKGLKKWGEEKSEPEKREERGPDKITINRLNELKGQGVSTVSQLCDRALSDGDRLGGEITKFFYADQESERDAIRRKVEGSSEDPTNDPGFLTLQYEDIRALDLIYSQSQEEGEQLPDLLKDVVVSQRHLVHLTAEILSSHGDEKRLKDLRKEFGKLQKRLDEQKDTLEELREGDEYRDLLGKEFHYEGEEDIEQVRAEEEAEEYLKKVGDFKAKTEEEIKTYQDIVNREKSIEENIAEGENVTRGDIEKYAQSITQMSARIVRPMADKKKSGEDDRDTFKGLQRGSLQLMESYHEAVSANDYQRAYQLLKKLRNNYKERLDIYDRGVGIFEHPEVQQDSGDVKVESDQETPAPEENALEEIEPPTSEVGEVVVVQPQKEKELPVGEVSEILELEKKVPKKVELPIPAETREKQKTGKKSLGELRQEFIESTKEDKEYQEFLGKEGGVKGKIRQSFNVVTSKDFQEKDERDRNSTLLEYQAALLKYNALLRNHGSDIDQEGHPEFYELDEKIQEISIELNSPQTKGSLEGQKEKLRTMKKKLNKRSRIFFEAKLAGKSAQEVLEEESKKPEVQPQQEQESTQDVGEGAVSEASAAVETEEPSELERLWEERGKLEREYERNASAEDAWDVVERLADQIEELDQRINVLEQETIPSDKVDKRKSPETTETETELSILMDEHANLMAEKKSLDDINATALDEGGRLITDDEEQRLNQIKAEMEKVDDEFERLFGNRTKEGQEGEGLFRTTFGWHPESPDIDEHHGYVDSKNELLQLAKGYFSGEFTESEVREYYNITGKFLEELGRQPNLTIEDFVSRFVAGGRAIEDEDVSDTDELDLDKVVW